MVYLRRIGLECSAAQSQSRSVLPQLPGSNTKLHDLVICGRRVDHVRDPGVPAPSQYGRSYADFESKDSSPARLNLRGVVFFLLVINPASSDFPQSAPQAEVNCARIQLTGKFFFHILVVLVAVAVGAN